MENYFDYYTQEDISSLRNKIIGLGENSIKKNYYPELQERLIELERINIRNKALLNGIPDTFFLLDRLGNIIEYHPSSNSKFFNKDIKYKNIKDILTDDISDLFLSNLYKINNVDEVAQFSFGLHLDKELTYYEARAVMVNNDEFLFIIRDITNEILMINKLKYLGSRDHLTGLYNRAVFEDCMKKFESSDYKSIGIVLCDVDGLKFINDTLGHKIGDRVIKSSAQILKKCFRSQDIISRIGGDEFAILLHSVDEQFLKNTCKKIEDEISNYNEKADKFKIGISVGYACRANSNGITDILFSEADNAMYRKKLLKNTGIRSSMVRTLMKALEARDYLTEGHAERLENIAVKIGESIGLNENNLDEIRLLAKFHDIGKVGIPDRILFKKDKLNDEEMRVMQSHCEIGHRIANSSPEVTHIANFILMHHEKWDGTGYPLGLKQNDIPIECRIIAIADAYDAMANDRPYRKAMKTEEILKEIINNAGTQFDPELVKVFLKILKKDLMNKDSI